jgi:NAD(P)H-dependent FMN reductase
MRLAIRALSESGLSVEELDLKQLAWPIYDGDVEERHGLPASVVEWKAKITACRGVLVVSPEYNGSIPGGLKNGIDWLSRPPANCFSGKVVSVSTASAGAFGGVRSTLAIKTIFSHLGAWVAPGAVNLAKAESAFDDAGELKEEWIKKSLAKEMKSFAESV